MNIPAFGKACLACTSLLILFSISLVANAEDYSESRRKNDHLWTNWHIYRGIDQRGGPYKFDDTYMELEFGGRSGIVSLYGYVDFLDIFHDSGSDKYRGDNFFAKVIPRFSLDGMFKKDLSLGPIKEWYIASTLIMADGNSTDGGLQVGWLGLGTDVEVPWLGTVGFDLMARYIADNYGASNQNSWDGYALHLNWFKPFYHFDNGLFLAFQGYVDYEFGSDMPDKNNPFEKQYRTDNAFQSYLGFWLHGKKWAVGYGAKVYDNMTQWKDGEVLDGKKTNTTGVGHYFNIAYKF